ncbi:MAG: phosphate signaling complex protein PhoU [Chloroflexota bacterium]|nr:phosphate signaling complex protein PhoU [Chloroflexota bacterium]MDH5244315.1 phosphate signaling complex protein PhoU [Chloroflexota bacterium]
MTDRLPAGHEGSGGPSAKTPGEPGLDPPAFVPALRDTLDREEQGIKDAVLRMGSQVEDAIRAASRALSGHDAALALDIIKGDAAINDAQRAATQLISVTIATQQPVARDLRYLLTLDHVTYELERMADHAASVAKQVIKLAPYPPLEGHVHLPEMAERCAVLTRGVMRALVDADATAAREIAAQDDDIDTLYHQTFDEVVALMRQDPANVERGTRIIIASHYLERIGDRCTNVAEDIVYLVTGDVEDLNP